MRITSKMSDEKQLIFKVVVESVIDAQRDKITNKHTQC